MKEEIGSPEHVCYGYEREQINDIVRHLDPDLIIIKVRTGRRHGRRTMRRITIFRKDTWEEIGRFG